MKLQKIFLILVSCLCWQLTSATIYQWQDNEGNTYFSDTPHKGAKEINLPTTQTYDPNKPLSEQSKSQKNKNDEPKTYESVTITQPENDYTLPNMEGNLNVAIEVLPKLMDGDSIQLVLDGKPIGGSQSSGAFSLNNLNRGTHSISAKIVNKDNEEVATSNSVSFHVRRPVIKQNLPVNQSNHTP